jgi:hypothetical protein
MPGKGLALEVQAVAQGCQPRHDRVERLGEVGLCLGIGDGVGHRVWERHGRLCTGVGI